MREVPSGSYLPSAKEARAIELFHSPEARLIEQRIASIFAADIHYVRDRQADLVTQAAAEHLYAALESVVQDTPGNPEIFRSLCHERCFAGGVILPGSRYGIDNPDNIYRLAVVDPARRYVLSGRRPANPSIDVGLTAMAGWSGDGRLADSSGFLNLLNLPTDAKGRFELELDGDPPRSRDNHFSIAGGRVLMFRDTQGDWSSEERFALRLRCISGATSQDDRTDAAIFEEAERLAVAMVHEFMGTLQHRYVEHHPANVIKSPRSSGDHGGLVTQHGSLGWYNLEDGEALIVDIDPLKARYFGFQLADLWTLAYDYTSRMASMNSNEALSDMDGRIRFVVSASDPGVHNWLDSGGHRTGSMTLRWQHADPAAGPHKDTVKCQLVKLADLTSALPRETRFVTEVERASQRARRAADWRVRMQGDIAEQALARDLP